MLCPDSLLTEFCRENFRCLAFRHPGKQTSTLEGSGPLWVGDATAHNHSFFGTAGILTGQLSAHAQTFFTYRCNDGSEFIAAFYEGDTRAHLQLDGKAMALPKRMSVSGSRYAKGDTTLRITKTGTTLKRGKRLTECSVR